MSIFYIYVVFIMLQNNIYKMLKILFKNNKLNVTVTWIVRLEVI